MILQKLTNQRYCHRMASSIQNRWNVDSERWWMGL